MSWFPKWEMYRSAHSFQWCCQHIGPWRLNSFGHTNWGPNHRSNYQDNLKRIDERLGLRKVKTQRMGWYIEELSYQHKSRWDNWLVWHISNCSDFRRVQLVFCCSWHYIFFDLGNLQILSQCKDSRNNHSESTVQVFTNTKWCTKSCKSLQSKMNSNMQVHNLLWKDQSNNLSNSWLRQRIVSCCSQHK